MSSLERRIRNVQSRIDAACQHAGREASSVVLVAVSKSVGRDEIDQAYELGLRNFGENRVQHAQVKFTGDWPPDATRHMIGSLQSNKAGVAIDLFDLIHSVDRQSLIDELARQAARRERTVDILLQVNVAAETQKAGCSIAHAVSLSKSIAATPELVLQGLMTIAPIVDEPESVRPVFASLHTLRDQLIQTTGHALPMLSMGMTNDFEIAIGEGATHIRVGRALFDPTTQS